jgi:C4-type Zn-finger protein
MKVFVVVNNVEGLVNQVEVRLTLPEAVDRAVELAAERCNSSREEIRAELDGKRSFESPNGDIIVTIDECEAPDS